jgi:flagellar basal-body rod modification protein FlgD
MTVASVTGPSQTADTTPKKTGLAALGQGDFLKLMTTQMQMQDPFDPMDNSQMLAQMAQFSQLAGVSEMGETLRSISGKLDALIAQQQAADTTAAPETSAETAS